ncbi:MAG: IPExxxVDY family protein [Bacteroidota bacterium]|nr:IPExxxVDY family protein [Bacteroidota bacterium]
MAKKLKLQIDSGSAFRIIGLSSTAKSYKMAFLINQALKLNLARSEDFLFYNDSVKQEIQYSLFVQIIPDSNGHICLLQNRHPEGFLIPILRQADYFVLLHENPQEHIIPEYLQKMKKTREILAAFPIDKPAAKNTARILEELEMHLMEHSK